MHACKRVRAPTGGDEGAAPRLAGERGRPAIAYRLREVKDYVLIKGRILNYVRETLFLWRSDRLERVARIRCY